MDGWMDGWVVGWINGWMDGSLVEFWLIHFFCVKT